MKNHKMYIMFALTIIVSVLSSCGAQQATTLTGNERDSVLAFSEAKTDTLLSGLNANDYASFSKDFDQDLLNAMPESEFIKLKQDRDSKLGLYTSRTVNTVIKNGDFYSVIYDAVFEKEPAVSVKVVFRVADPHQISGLWFDK